MTNFNFFQLSYIIAKEFETENLDRNLIMPLLIMAICTMLFEKLHTMLR